MNLMHVCFSSCQSFRSSEHWLSGGAREPVSRHMRAFIIIKICDRSESERLALPSIYGKQLRRDAISIASRSRRSAARPRWLHSDRS